VLNTSDPDFNSTTAAIGDNTVALGDNVSVEIVPASYANANSAVSMITVDVLLVSTALSSVGGGGFSVTTIKTANYTAVDRDYVRTDPASGTFNVTLPLAANNVNGIIKVKHVSDSGNNVSVIPSGSDTIDDLSSHIVSAREEFSFTSNGVDDWMVG
jgi:hypothetical protein